MRLVLVWECVSLGVEQVVPSAQGEAVSDDGMYPFVGEKTVSLMQELDRKSIRGRHMHGLPVDDTRCPLKVKGRQPGQVFAGVIFGLARNACVYQAALGRYQYFN